MIVREPLAKLGGLLGARPALTRIQPDTGGRATGLGVEKVSGQVGRAAVAGAVGIGNNQVGKWPRNTTLYSDRKRHEITGRDSGPIEKITLDMDPLEASRIYKELMRSGD